MTEKSLPIWPLLTSENLLIGDILLHKAKNSTLIDRKITKSTGSYYTHASIYIGDNQIAEAMPPIIRKRLISEAIHDASHIGVLRTQLVFTNERALKLKSYVEYLVNNWTLYDALGAVKYPKFKNKYAERQFDLLKNYSEDKWISNYRHKLAFFCSALVVACLSEVGIVDGAAQILYHPDSFAPGDLHEDPTFGWFLGFLTNEAAPPNEDVLLNRTQWKDNTELQWW